VYRSPDGNFVLRMRTERAGEVGIRELGERRLAEFTRRGSNVEVVKKELTQADG
jgi:hypothetical protein